MRRLLGVLALVVALTACGDDEPRQLSSESSEPPSLSGCINNEAAASAAGTTDLSKKPQIEVPDRPPPCELVIADIVKGTGAEAVSGQKITVKYVGVTYADGKEFDASWGGEDFPFQLGAGQVIGGWDQGCTGMKEGGRRQLVIPPQLGYGETGSGAIPPNATLVFVVDLVKVG